MSTYLAIGGREYSWTIVWIVDDDEGATLGQDRYKDSDLEKVQGDLWEHVAATLAVSKTEGVKFVRSDFLGGHYIWESLSDAKKALRAAKAAVKDKRRKPWPEWAVKAQANGWKPPKGWAP
jgi:hypothetical protein